MGKLLTPRFAPAALSSKGNKNFMTKGQIGNFNYKSAWYVLTLHIYVDQISNRSCLSVSLSLNCYFPPSWAPQARSEAWEVYPWELHPPDDPPRPSRPKVGLGLVMMMMIMMVWRGLFGSFILPAGQSFQKPIHAHPTKFSITFCTLSGRIVHKKI